MNWLLNNYESIPFYLFTHLRLSILPIAIGFVLALPLGWLAWRFQVTRGLLLTLVGLLYTIPSLALFALLPPLLGLPYLSEANVEIALTIYAVALMARSAADAFGSVDPGVRQSAVAMGYGTWRRIWEVELPLAGPVLLAGLRVVAVSTVALVTVGVLVGVQSLGFYFTDGSQRQIPFEVFTGVVLTMLLALAIDGLLVLLGRALMPWARPSKRRPMNRWIRALGTGKVAEAVR
ncbi:MAG: ABC transporter permease subunit [Actinomycetales bacterium]|nr:ABC transporter permease subunit [Actinomycetales bacterium]